jgi:hypothetical protein
MTDERVSQQQAREALKYDLRIVSRFIEQHPDTPAASAQPVAWRYLKQITRSAYATTRWLGMDEFHHYGPDGNLVAGADPEWKNVEFAYCPAPPSDDGLRRALLAVVEDLESMGPDSGVVTIARRLRKLAGQGTPSVEHDG